MIKCFYAWEDIEEPTHSLTTMGLFPWEQMQMTKRKEHLTFSMKHFTNTGSVHVYVLYGRDNTDRIRAPCSMHRIRLCGKKKEV